MGEEITLEGGSYEILRGRLNASGDALRSQLNLLNDARKEVFGSIDTKLLSTERITTEHNCIPWDIYRIGSQFIFGYNVFMGLKTEIQISDVFSVFQFHEDESGVSADVFLNDEKFVEDFKNLYKYYKHTQFVKFTEVGNYVFFVFRVGKLASDIKTFKFLKKEDTLTYVDSRSDHEMVAPNQHHFEWIKVTRDHQKEGAHPHYSIEDKIFIETIGGDFTIKIEDNTDTGQGIFSEPVEAKDQSLDDAEMYYSVVGNLIVLKVKPYREENFRYVVYNDKVKEAIRLDELEHSCVLLPDDQGIIFSNGYYLQTGHLKTFDTGLTDMQFERTIASPNGEDYLYVFYNKQDGVYVLLSYNIIEQEVEKPIICHGFVIFDNGEMCFFKADSEAKKHHAVQIWQTPYIGHDFEINSENDSYLAKIGNKDIVKAMAECHEILGLLGKEDSYDGLYVDLMKTSVDVLDTYHWLTKEETFELAKPLLEIKETAVTAIDEFEKVTQIKKDSAKQLKEMDDSVQLLVKTIKNKAPENINDFVAYLGDLRKYRGQVVALKDLRYIDVAKVGEIETVLEEFAAKLSEDCVAHLLDEASLEPYQVILKTLQEEIENAATVVICEELDGKIDTFSKELEMLIEIVNNLKIKDATQTARIIDNISTIYSSINQMRSGLKRRRKELASVEGKAEFNVQFKLVDQAVISYLDLSTSPELCEEYLSKLMVQLEELEVRFSEFDEYLDKIGEKRQELYTAFENKKVALIEERSKKSNQLVTSANRILKSVQNRVARFETLEEINGYFVSDLMVEKVRNIISDLLEMEDSVKADEVQSKLKSTQEEAIRQLKDKNELFVEGQDVIKFGKYAFNVNTQKLGLTIVYKEDGMYFHLTGTGFYEKIENAELTGYQDLWNRNLVSESDEVYRAEYLAYQLLNDSVENNKVEELLKATSEELLEFVQKSMALKYNEGYVKGVHDADALIILQALLMIHQNAGLLVHSPAVRTAAILYWEKVLGEEDRRVYTNRIKRNASILGAFPQSKSYAKLVDELNQEVSLSMMGSGLFSKQDLQGAGTYLFFQIKDDKSYVLSHEAVVIKDKFVAFLKKNKQLKSFEESVKLVEDIFDFYSVVNEWLLAFVEAEELEELASHLPEATLLLAINHTDASKAMNIEMKKELEGMQGNHELLVDQKLHLGYNSFMQKLTNFSSVEVPRFNAFHHLKQDVISAYESDLKLGSFKPKVMSSFVRNKLIDELYLPIIGENLAKQIGEAGENKRTDLMGMLLLISPPGYGKTTLMEYVANRLGLIFMKINGPALGHNITSVDPAEAKNAATKEELEKLNLAFEMGDNVMIYLDDIQHCNPEFLQKFISLCDGQRKIEGVFKGQSKTYDFRGKKVAVVMAGNPYTESGDKFRIPDMLANRADIYNLGDIIGDTEDIFKLSYLENSMTSNATLNAKLKKSINDFRAIIKMVETGSKEVGTLEQSYGAAELKEIISVVEKMVRIRDIILKVNLAYIYSAAQADEFRTEPAFKLQGSYRNMNKIAAKVLPIMNDEELETLVLSHYVGESQTLTSGAEANMLKFKELIGSISDEENARWNAIKATFQKSQKIKGMGGNEMGIVVDQMQSINKGIEGIKEALFSIGKN